MALSTQRPRRENQKGAEHHNGKRGLRSVVEAKGGRDSQEKTKSNRKERERKGCPVTAKLCHIKGRGDSTPRDLPLGSRFGGSRKKGKGERVTCETRGETGRGYNAVFCA